MLDEFEDATWPANPKQDASGSTTKSDPVPRLISRIYVASDVRLRASLLRRLLDPLGTLGMAAVAAGAFAGFLQRRSDEGIRVSVDDVGRYSSDQIAELVRFVGQVSPESLQAVANTFVDNPVGVTAFSASVIVLLMRALRRAGPSSSAESQGVEPSAERPGPNLGD